MTHPNRSEQRCSAGLPVLDTLEELTGFVTRSQNVYLRFSHGPEQDLLTGYSRDYESGLDMPGLSVSAVEPEHWWTRPPHEWVARRIRQYAQLADEDGRFAWILTGRHVGTGPDHEPLVDRIEPLARLTSSVLAEADRVYHSAFDVACDSTDRPSPG